MNELHKYRVLYIDKRGNLSLSCQMTEFQADNLFIQYDDAKFLFQVIKRKSDTKDRKYK